MSASTLGARVRSWFHRCLQLIVALIFNLKPFLPENKEMCPSGLDAATDSGLATFDRFMDLPPELRILVYGFYFGDEAIRAKGQRQTKHATTLLLANRKVHNEASVVRKKICERVA